MASSLYADVERTVRSGRIRKPINVLLLGPSGVGKSSFINSMIMAIDPTQSKCREHASKGAYGAGSGRGAFTQSLRCFSVGKIVESGLRVPVNFWDFPGLPDSKDDITATIAALLLDGCLQENAKYDALKQLGMRGLNRLTKEQKAERVINLVAYVHAATDSVQENLLQSVQLLTRDPSRDLVIFLVITKMDKVENNPATEKFLQNCKARMIPALGLVGCDEKVFEIKNYCSETTKGRLRREASLDEKLLDLWDCILDPVFNNQRLPVPNVSRCTIL